MKEDRCRSCRAPILWGTTQAGVPHPVDLEPNQEGNLVEEEDGRLRVIAGPLEVPSGTVIYMSHFATCPHAGDWRKRGKR